MLDVCCGTGTQCHLLNKEGIQCIGVDISPGMLKVAGRKNFKQNRFIRMDSTALAFRNEVFDGAIISFALHEKSYRVRKAIARETKRVVKERGFILVADYMVSASTGKADWKANIVEFMAGMEHYRRFRDFCRRGGLIGVEKLFDSPGTMLKTFRRNTWGLLLIEKT